MTISAQIVETIAEATGLARTTITSTFHEIDAVVGDRMTVMKQRVSGIMANAPASGGINGVVDYTDGVLTAGEKARVFGALGLGFIGGLLFASAAGSIAVILVALLCLAGAGMLLMSYAKSLIGKLSDAIDAF